MPAFAGVMIDGYYRAAGGYTIGVSGLLTGRAQRRLHPRCRTGGQHEISLWQPGSATRLRADLRRAGQPDGRVDAPLLAAGVHIGRAWRPAAEGKALVRGDRRLSRQARAGRRARPALRASRRLARMGPGRGERLALLLSRLAIRHARPMHRHAVRERGDPPEPRRVAAGVQDARIWRARLRLYGPARQRALIPGL